MLVQSVSLVHRETQTLYQLLTRRGCQILAFFLCDEDLAIPVEPNSCQGTSAAAYYPSKRQGSSTN